jgi:hypothetical protein
MVPPELALRSECLEPPERGEADLSNSLSWVFRQVYGAVRPQSLLVAPLASGEALEHVDPLLTRRAVGIDSDMEKVAVARQRYRQLGPLLELYCADALHVRLQPEADFDLVYVALPLDRIEPEPLADAIAGWVAPGGACAVVSRRGGAGEPVASAPLESESRLPSELSRLFAARGLRRAGAWETRLGGSARAWVGLFRAAAGPKYDSWRSVKIELDARRAPR